MHNSSFYFEASNMPGIALHALYKASPVVYMHCICEVPSMVPDTKQALFIA